jgi:serine protease Do
VGLNASRLWAWLGAILIALAAPPALADPADIAAASRGVVRVVLVNRDGENVTYVGHGSGFAVTPTLVLTNAHVVAALRENDTMIAGVVPSEGSSGYKAELVAYSPVNDLALLRLVDKGALPALTVFAGAVSDGAEVYAVGYPGNVDLAQGLSLAEIVQPQAALKTRGYVSTGRSSRQFETLLHTAPIGSGNSGGPLLDGCGRVIGVNSFGTLSEGADSKFYFAVSAREVLGFLRQADVTPHATAMPCRSIADLDREEVSEQARREADAGRHANVVERARESAQHKAELQVLAERENGMALAALLLVLAVLAGGAAGLLEQRGRRRPALLAGAAAMVLLVAAGVVWFARPSLAVIDERAAAELAPTAKPPAPPSGRRAGGAMVCVFDPAHSRATVSDAADVQLAWGEGGCVNGRTQYGRGADGWSRILVPTDEATVAINSYDPATRAYKVERFLLDLPAMNAAREARGRYTAPACGGGDAVARRLGQDQAAVRALLPSAPNERLIYRCQPR